ncbi:hypothetical protein Glove_355g18 [Diversispora epigaea]|uniref:Uncharacterized protein n=1 Tax=Diversispora epigaea TaxID=1348612 RepID=A0A397HB35_9GLOM|nr:hypothetical protein Glove_355g18 [Diversispora epigaea]
MSSCRNHSQSGTLGKFFRRITNGIRHRALTTRLQRKKRKIGTISGIKSYHEWTWPDQGEYIGFIYVRISPEIGEWKKWASTQIEKI